MENAGPDPGKDYQLARPEKVGLCVFRCLEECRTLSGENMDDSKACVIYWYGSVQQNNWLALHTELLKAAGEKFRKCYLVISSRGGDTKGGIQAYNAIREAAQRMVMITVAGARVDSAAVLLFAAGDEKVAVKGSSFLFHDVTVSARCKNGETSELSEAGLKNLLARLRHDRADMWAVLLNAYPATEVREELKSLGTRVSEGDVIVSAEDAVALGLADRLVDSLQQVLPAEAQWKVISDQ